MIRALKSAGDSAPWLARPYTSVEPQGRHFAAAPVGSEPHRTPVGQPEDVAAQHPPFSLDLAFKGSRCYLRFADIYSELTKLAQKRFAPAAFVESLVLRRLVTHRVQACFQQEAKAFGSFRIRHGTRRIPGWLVETDVPTSARVPYETEAAESAIISEPQFARFSGPMPGHTAIDQVVLLMKALSQQIGQQEWLFCRSEQSVPFSESAPLEVRVRETVSDRFFIGAVSQQQNPVGSAIFAAGRKQ